MRLPFLFAVLLLACVLVASARAGDLDAPGAKPVTLRSEVERGRAAVERAVEETALDRDKTHTFGDKIKDLLATNQQARTDSEGFQLGLHFAAWQAFWQLLSWGQATDNSTVAGHVDLAPDIAATSGQVHFLYFRQGCQRNDLTPAQLQELFAGDHYDPARDDAAWQAAVKATAFKGTKREK